MVDEETVAVQPGQAWSHPTKDFEVTVTRVSNTHVHFAYPEEEAKQQTDAVKDIVEEDFEEAFVHIAPVMGSVAERNEFTDEYTFERMRKLEPFESWHRQEAE